MQLAIAELFPAMNIAQGYLAEIDAAAEEVDGPRLRRAFAAALPQLMKVNIALIIAGKAIEVAGHGAFATRTTDEEQVKVLVAINRAARGPQGALLHHLRALQADVLQARKLFVYLDAKHQAARESPAAWRAFEDGLQHVASEFDSIMFTFRVVNHFLP